MVKKLPANAEDIRDVDSIPGSGRSPEGGRQPTPVFLPGESHRQRSLAGCSPWGHKESNMTEATWQTRMLDHTIFLCIDTKSKAFPLKQFFKKLSL